MEIRLDAIGIVVADLARSVQFYRLLGVGFEDPGDSPHHEATLPNGLRFMMDTEELMQQMEPGWKRPEGQAMGIAFLCGSAAEVDSAYESVLAAGFKGKKEPWDAFWGQRYALVLDPDGNETSLFAPLDK